jgi:hypothetical protein
LTTYGQTRSFARRLEKTNARSDPGRIPVLPDGGLARRDHRLVDEETDLPGLGEVEHRGEKRDARHDVFIFLG